MERISLVMAMVIVNVKHVKGKNMAAVLKMCLLASSSLSICLSECSNLRATEWIFVTFDNGSVLQRFLTCADFD
jgi:hypothetical protein